MSLGSQPAGNIEYKPGDRLRQTHVTFPAAGHYHPHSCIAT